jgi:hypothetical protein
VIIAGDPKALDINGITLQASMKASAMGETMDVDMYMANGIMYMEDEALGGKIALSYSELMALNGMDMEEIMAMALQMSDPGAFDIPANMVKNIEKGTRGGYTDYSAVLDGRVLAELFDEYMDAVLGTMVDLEGLGDVNMSVSFGDVAVMIEVDGNNVLRRIVMEMPMHIDIEGLLMSMELALDCTVTAMGEQVKVSLPDLTQYTLLSVEDLMGI